MLKNYIKIIYKVIKIELVFKTLFYFFLFVQKKKNTKIVNPPSKELTKLFNSEFKSIKKVLCI